MKKVKKLMKKIFKKSKMHSEKTEKKIARIATLMFFVFGIYFSLNEFSMTGNMILSSDTFLSINLIGALLTLVSFVLLVILSKED